MPVEDTKKQADKRKKILILGGGFGGVMAARALAEKRIPDVSITLVDKSDFHSYTSDFYEVATAFISEESHKGGDRVDFYRLRSSAAVLFKDIFHGMPVEFIRGEVEGIDPKSKEVSLSGGRTLPYHYLVIALGSETNFMNIPHLEERALELKSLQDALNIRNAIDEIFLTSPKADIIRIVVGGGGYTGCELAGELIGYIKKLSHIHGHPFANIECSLIEASKSLLGTGSVWLQNRALKRLEDLEIQIYTNSPITDVEKDTVVLKDGRKIPYTLLIWTAGIRPNKIAASLDGAVTAKNPWLQVDATLNLKSYKNIYAIGDIAFYSDFRDKTRRVPATAQTAIDQGVYIADSIWRREKNRLQTPYRPHSSRFIVPLGGKYVLADFGWFRLTGSAAWFMKRLVALRYFAKLLSWKRAWILWRGDLRLYVKND